jgi:signal peptidase I
MRARILVGALATLVAIGVASVVYVGFVVLDGLPGTAFKNVSASMAPTLLPGERFTVRYLHGRATIARNALVAHVFPGDASKELVKRIVGLPGDTLTMNDGQLEVNHRRVREPFAWHATPETDPVFEDFDWQRSFLVDERDAATYKPSRDTWGPLIVPRDRYFVLGDNRDNSLDSRYFGFLTRDQLVGQVRRIYFSKDSTGHIRWSRLGGHPR